VINTATHIFLSEIRPMPTTLRERCLPPGLFFNKLAKKLSHDYLGKFCLRQSRDRPRSIRRQHPCTGITVKQKGWRFAKE